MIDKWFKKDIEKVLKDKNIIVFIDESKEGSFLLNSFSMIDFTFLNASTLPTEVPPNFKIFII